MDKASANKAALDTVEICDNVFDAYVKKGWSVNAASKRAENIQHWVFLKLCEGRDVETET